MSGLCCEGCDGESEDEDDYELDGFCEHFFFTNEPPSHCLINITVYLDRRSQPDMSSQILTTGLLAFVSR